MKEVKMSSFPSSTWPVKLFFLFKLPILKFGNRFSIRYCCDGPRVFRRDLMIPRDASPPGSRYICFSLAHLCMQTIKENSLLEKQSKFHRYREHTEKWIYECCWIISNLDSKIRLFLMILHKMELSLVYLNP